MITASDILNARILIVDDKEANVTLLEQMLRGAGYVSIASTTDPREVCDRHRENRYDLIVLDLQMPAVDGFTVMEGLEEIETGGYLPVLVITAEPRHKLRALTSGAKDFISKPFDLAEVLARVHNLLEVRLLHLKTKALYETLQTTNQELEAFSYSASHDLRAPLRRVLSFVELLQTDADPSLSEIHRRHLSTIAKSARRMGNLIDDLLTFSHAGHAALRTTDVNLDQLIQETLRDLQVETKERHIAWDIHSLPAVRADSALLRMVLVNLISNAMKFTGARAEATIEIGHAPNANGETVIFIRDNGAGFDPQYSEKLFGVFQRLHSRDQFEGTGLGLAIVKRIIQRHGGRVWAEGAVGTGATFYFSIPN